MNFYRNIAIKDFAGLLRFEPEDPTNCEGIRKDKKVEGEVFAKTGDFGRAISEGPGIQTGTVEETRTFTPKEIPFLKVSREVILQRVLFVGDFLLGEGSF